MAVPVGINGFGRIGRLAFRAMANQDIQVVGINDVVEPKVLAHLLKYDSVHGQFPGSVGSDGDALVVNGKRIPVSAERDPAKIPWKKWGARIAVDMANLAGFSHAGAPVMTRGSAKRPTSESATAAVISSPAAARTGLPFHSVPSAFLRRIRSDVMRTSSGQQFLCCHCQHGA